MQSLHNQILRSRVSTSTKLKLYDTCILPIYLYGSDCWAVSRTDACKIDAFIQWCLQMLLRIKWHQFVQNDEVRRLTGQPKLIAIVQSRRLTLFGHIAHMDENTDTKRILSTPSRGLEEASMTPDITWLSTIQQDLRSHNLALPEAVDMTQNQSLWRMWLTYGTTQSRVACQQRQRPLVMPKLRERASE